jgi:hypothetical protein
MKAHYKKNKNAKQQGIYQPAKENLQGNAYEREAATRE